MKLSDWTSVAEIVSGVAVVVTLIFLSVGIRENTNTVRVAVFSNLTDATNELERDIYLDPELSLVWANFLSGETDGLDATQSTRLRGILTAGFRNFDKAFFAQKYNVIGQAEWRRFDTAICSIQELSLRSLKLDFSEHPTLTDEFREYIASCSNGSE